MVFCTFILTVHVYFSWLSSSSFWLGEFAHAVPLNWPHAGRQSRPCTDCEKRILPWCNPTSRYTLSSPEATPVRWVSHIHSPSMACLHPRLYIALLADTLLDFHAVSLPTLEAFERTVNHHFLTLALVKRAIRFLPGLSRAMTLCDLARFKMETVVWNLYLCSRLVCLPICTNIKSLLRVMMKLEGWPEEKRGNGVCSPEYVWYLRIIFFNLVFFLKSWLLIVYFYAKWFFFWKFTRLKWSRHSLRPKLREIRSFKLQDVNVVQNSHFFVQNLYLTWLYVILIGDSENVLFFCYYFQFLPSPSPSPMDIRCNRSKRNKSFNRV